MLFVVFFLFFQAEDGIRDVAVTGVQTCALPISRRERIRSSALPFFQTGSGIRSPICGSAIYVRRRRPAVKPPDPGTATAARGGGRRGSGRVGWATGDAWPGAESNRRHADFQSAALPTELPGPGARNIWISAPLSQLSRPPATRPARRQNAGRRPAFPRYIPAPCPPPTPASPTSPFSSIR